MTKEEESEHHHLDQNPKCLRRRLSAGVVLGDKTKRLEPCE